MWHARQGGADAAAVVQYLIAVGDADVQPGTVPLAMADRDAMVGKYTYGSGPRDHFTVEVRRDMAGRDQLVMERPVQPPVKTSITWGIWCSFQPASRAQRSRLPGKGRRSHD